MRRPARALMRGISDRWAHALREHDDGPLDRAAAVAQHAATVRILRDLGVAVTVLSPDPEHADACFTEDTAVVLGRHALLTRPGAESRRGEVATVAPALSAWGLSLHPLPAPATLEGGDVLRVGDRLFVGESRRTNAAGIDGLRAVAAREGLTVHAVALPDQMHLKGAVTLADAATAVVDPRLLDPAVAEGFGVAVVEAAESVGANVLAMGDGVVLVPAEAPRTAAALTARGLTCVPVPGAEIHRADGRITCLSLRWTPVGWCA